MVTLSHAPRLISSAHESTVSLIIAQVEVGSGSNGVSREPLLY